MDELRAVAAQVFARGGARELERAVVRGLALVARVAQEHPELGDRRGELEVRRGVAIARTTIHDADAQELARACVRLLVAELDRHQLARAGAPGRLRRLLVLERVDAGVLDLLAGGDYLVERRDGVARADLARVLAVVVEIAVGEQAVLVADEPVAGHQPRVELDLYLHVLRDRQERRAGLLAQSLARLRLGVDVGVITVPLVGQLLHHRVVEVAGAEAEDGEEDAALPLLLDEADERVVARQDDVEVAGGGEGDAVRAAAQEVLLRDAVGELNPLAAVRRAARFEPFDGRDDLALAVAGG